jgi:osmoprotectant transport system substrate-binding protein
MRRSVRLAAVCLLPVLALSACTKKKDTVTPSASGSGATSGGAPVSVTVGSNSFDESTLLAYLYGGALEKAGVKVKYQLKVGSREVSQPAVEHGEIDVMPEYAGNLLTAVDPAAQKPGDVPSLVAKLKGVLEPKGITVSEVSPATDGDVLAVTQATADRYHLAKVSDLKPVAGQLVFAGPAECKTRITCLKGLEQVYGLHFKRFASVDELATRKSSLVNGQAQVARLFSADTDIKAKHFVLLTDDQGIQPAGNVIAEIRKAKATQLVVDTINKVSAALTTDELIALDDQIYTGKKDPSDVAAGFLSEKGLG